MSEILLCPTTWGRYHTYKETTEMILGVSPEKSATINLVKMPRDELRRQFDAAPNMRTLGPSWTRAAREYVADRLPDSVNAGLLVKHVLIYHVLRALPLITDRLFVSPEGELFEGVLRKWRGYTLVCKGEGRKLGWMLEDVTVVEPGDQIRSRWKLALTATFLHSYSPGETPASVDEGEWARRKNNVPFDAGTLSREIEHTEVVE